MTNLEKSSKRKVISIKYQVEHGEKSIGTALREVEKLNDEGLLMQNDYEEIAEYLENLIEEEEKQEEPSIEETIAEDTENEQNPVEEINNEVVE